MMHDPEARASADDRPTRQPGSYDTRFAFDYQPIDELGDGQRWSTWGSCPPLARGPQPWPDWIITDDAAVDTELGVLKTGKEADVFLVERAAPLDDRTVMLAAKRYRDAQHRSFHRTSDYVEGRRLPRKGGREAGRWPGERRSGSRWRPTAGHGPSGSRWCVFTGPACRCPIRCRSTAPSC